MDSKTVKLNSLTLRPKKVEYPFKRILLMNLKSVKMLTCYS